MKILSCDSRDILLPQVNTSSSGSNNCWGGFCFLFHNLRVILKLQLIYENRKATIRIMLNISAALCFACLNQFQLKVIKHKRKYSGKSLFESHFLTIISLPCWLPVHWAFPCEIVKKNSPIPHLSVKILFYTSQLAF